MRGGERKGLKDLKAAALNAKEVARNQSVSRSKFDGHFARETGRNSNVERQAPALTSCEWQLHF